MRPGTSGLQLNEKLIFDHTDPGRKGYSLPKLDVPAAELSEDLVRKEIEGFPEVSEVDVVRHQQRLAPGQAQKKALMSGTLEVVRQDLDHLSFPFDLQIAAAFPPCLQQWWIPRLDC